MQRGVECEQRDFVLVAKLRQDRLVRLPRHGDLGADAHAAAHVDQNGQRDRRLPIGAEVDDRPELSVVPDLEVRGVSPRTTRPRASRTDA